MWGASGLIVVIIITDAIASSQLKCVGNYLSEEVGEVGVVLYLGEGSENIRVYEDLVSASNLTWTVINHLADSHDIIGAPGNYLVVAEGSNPVKVARRTLSHLSKFHEIWDPSARMIVLFSLSDPTLSVRNHRRLASYVIQVMWDHSVFDAMVIFQKNDLDGGLRVYGANPFTDENRCGENVGELVDWGCDGGAVHYEAERNIWRHPAVFPNCQFRVSRRVAPPFSFLSPENVWNGADILFVELLSARKNFNVVWSERPGPESGASLEEVHKYYDDFARGGINLAVGGAVMNHRQIHKVHYLRPHEQVSLVFYVVDSRNMKGWDTLHTMFTLPIWLTLGLSLLCGGICYSVVVEGRFNFKRTKFLQLLAILVTQTIVFPKRWRLRIFLVVFLFPLYHISSLHSTALQSFMVHTPKQKPISSEAELRALKIPVYTSEATRVLISDTKAHENILVSSTPLVDRLETLDKAKNYSILARSLEVDFWRNLRHFQIHPIRPPLSTFAVSLTMGKGSPYIDVVDTLAQQCLEVGLFEKWVADQTRVRSGKTKQNLYDSVALEPLDLEDLECAFLLLAVGLMISTGVFFGELYVHNCLSGVFRKTRKRPGGFVQCSLHIGR